MTAADPMGFPHLTVSKAHHDLLPGLSQRLLRRPEVWNVHPTTKSAKEVRVVVAMTVEVTVARKTISCGLLQGGLSPKRTPRLLLQRQQLRCKDQAPNYELPWPEEMVSHSTSRKT